MGAFDNAWNFLKADPIDMHEYPPGSGNFMSLKDMMEARNAAARLHLQRPNPNAYEGPRELSQREKYLEELNDMRAHRDGTGKYANQPTPAPNRPVPQNIMVSPTGNLSDIPEEQRWNPLG